MGQRNSSRRQVRRVEGELFRDAVMARLNGDFENPEKGAYERGYRMMEGLVARIGPDSFEYIPSHICGLN